MLHNALLLVVLVCAAHAEVPPAWVVEGILYQETRSYYRADGNIKYVDTSRGAAGEYGPFQMTRIAWRQIRRKGEPFWKLETDTKYAEELAVRYLVWLDTHYGKGDWHRNIEMYNAGPGNRSPKYLSAILARKAQRE